MAKLNIVKIEDPILRKTSKPVDKITERTLTLLDDMLETMRDANGAGLAAVQVGVLRRIVLVEVDGRVYELINPKIISQEGENEDIEGCLSVPGKMGITIRPMKVTVEALDREGNTVRYDGEGLLAKAFCHEIDHLDGIIYTDKAIKMLTPKEMREYEN